MNNYVFVKIFDYVLVKDYINWMCTCKIFKFIAINSMCFIQLCESRIMDLINLRDLETLKYFQTINCNTTCLSDDENIEFYCAKDMIDFLIHYYIYDNENHYKYLLISANSNNVVILDYLLNIESSWLYSLEYNIYLNKNISNIDYCFRIACRHNMFKLLKYVIHLDCCLDFNEGFILACTEQHFKCAKYVFEETIKHNCNLDLNLCLEICLNKNNNEMFKYFYNRTQILYKDLMLLASINGNLEIIKFLLLNNIEMTHDSVKNAVLFDHLDVVKYLKELNYNIEDYIIYSIRSGNVDLAKYFFNSYSIKPTNHIIDLVPHLSRYGFCNMIKFLFENNLYDQNKLQDYITNSCLSGNLELFLFYYNMQVAVSRECFLCACKGGNLNIVRFLHREGYDVSCDINTRIKNNLQLLIYLNIHSNILDDPNEYLLFACLKNYNLKILKYIIKNGGQLNHDCISALILNSNLSAIKYFVETYEIEFTEYEFLLSIEVEDYEIMKYIYSFNNITLDFINNECLNTCTSISILQFLYFIGSNIIDENIMC
jgi:hypothetical protein